MSAIHIYIYALGCGGDNLAVPVAGGDIEERLGRADQTYNMKLGSAQFHRTYGRGNRFKTQLRTTREVTANSTSALSSPKRPSG